jgi:ATP/maltotriose-dependent transcriptional regulator MalT
VAEPLVSLGRWDEAIEVIEHALALSPPELNRILLRLLLAEIALRRGDLDVAAAMAAAARTAHGRAKYPGTYEGQYTLPLAQVEAEILYAQGRQAAAVEAISGAIERLDLVRDPRYAWPLLTAASQIATRPWAGAPPGAGAAGLAGAGGPIGAGGLGEALLDQLSELAGKMQATGPVQRAGQLTLDALIFEAQSGPAHVLKAQTSEGQAGTEPRQRRARWESAAAAGSAGAALTRRSEPDRPVAARLGLTAREFEVLRLVADGRSNPEVGAELFITAKTASVHVSNILAKLGVNSRGEAAAAAHRLRLFETASAS